MTNELAAGHNAPIGEHALKFSVSAPGCDADVVGLVVDAHLQVRSSADVVFYNQTQTAGLGLSGTELSIDLTAVRPGSRVLCAVGLEQVGPEHVSSGSATAGMRAELTGSGRSPGFSLALRPAFGETALLCFELYERAGQWKVRALGQGYAGGLAQLMTSHGVEVDDAGDAAVGASRAVEAPAAQPVSQSEADVRPETTGLGTDRGAAIARAHVIFEDAARSAAGFVQAEAFAQERLDRELAETLSDPSQRTAPAAARRREAAQKRCDDLVASARQRFDSDSRVLMTELAALDPQLPPAMASWQSSAWQHTGGHTGSGVRLGELSATERGELRLPFCIPTPIPRPIWVVETDQSVVATVTSLTLRLAAAATSDAATGPETVAVDIMDLTGKLSALTGLLAPVTTASAVTTPDSVGDRLDVFESAIDLTFMALQAEAGGDSGVLDDFGARVVVVADLPYGWEPGDLARLLRIVDRGTRVGWSFVFAGPLDNHDGDPLVAAIADTTLVLPVTDHAYAHDPWVGLQWLLTADELDPQSTIAQQIAAGLHHRRSPSNSRPQS